MTIEIPDLLTELTRATEDHLGSLREYVWQAPGVNNGRLVTAMDAVWYRNIDTHISEGSSSSSSISMLISSSSSSRLPRSGNTCSLRTGAVEELKIWQDLFPQYSKETAEKRAAAPGGEHGDKALTILVNHYLGGTAAPGFGNHTNGIAVDFNAVQGGTSLATLRSQNAQWIKSWLYLCHRGRCTSARSSSA
jgi:hypothetical protein